MAAATGPASFRDGDISDTKVSVIDAFSLQGEIICSLRIAKRHAIN